MTTRFSQIAHDGILLWNPLPEAATLALVDQLPLGPGTRVLDVGCGQAELLIRLLARTGGTGVGIDSWPHAMTRARTAAAERLTPGQLTLRDEAFDAAQFAAASFDVALCIGATHAIGDLRATLTALHRLLAPGGIAIIGEAHWMQDPAADYLAFLGCSRESVLSRENNVAVARECGFELARDLVTTTADFARYEDRYAANVERFAAQHPNDPDAAPFLARIRAWRSAYLRHGRDTLGFALYVLRRA